LLPASSVDKSEGDTNLRGTGVVLSIPCLNYPRPLTLLQKVAQASDDVSTKLWFLDLKFKTFATPSLVGFAFLAVMLIGMMALAATTFHALWNYPALQAIGGIVAAAILLLLAIILVRVFFESLLIAFRIAEHLKSIANSAQSLPRQRENG